MQPYGLVVVTPPAAEPLSTVEAKLHVRVDHDAEDNLIAALITAARTHCEDLLERALITQTLRATWDRFPCPEECCQDDWWRPVLVLPKPPLISITSVQYVDSNGTLQTLSPSVYESDSTRLLGRLAPAYGQVWPVTRVETFAAVRVTYEAGYGGSDDVPGPIKQAMLLLIGHLYEHRKSVVEGSWAELPMGVQPLLMPYWAGRYC